MFFTVPTLSLRAADVVRFLDRSVRTGRDRLRRRPAPVDCSRSSVNVEHVVDPDGSTRLVRVTGLVTDTVMPCLSRSWDDMLAAELLHIDLRDATIADLTTMQALERAVDHLERQGIDIRIVGLDPAHPAIASLPH